MEQGWNLETGSGNGGEIWNSDWLWKRGWDLEFGLDRKRGRDLELEPGTGIGRPGFGVVGKLDIKKSVDSRIRERKFRYNGQEVCVGAKSFRCRYQKKSGSCLAAATLG